MRSEGADFPYGEVVFVFQAGLGLDEYDEMNMEIVALHYFLWQ